MVGVAANGVDDVVDHLHPMVGQRHRQVDVGRRLEPGVGEAVEHLRGAGWCAVAITPSH